MTPSENIEFWRALANSLALLAVILVCLGVILGAILSAWLCRRMVANRNQAWLEYEKQRHERRIAGVQVPGVRPDRDTVLRFHNPADHAR